MPKYLPVYREEIARQRRSFIRRTNPITQPSTWHFPLINGLIRDHGNEVMAKQTAAWEITGSQSLALSVPTGTYSTSGLGSWFQRAPSYQS